MVWNKEDNSSLNANLHMEIRLSKWGMHFGKKYRWKKKIEKDVYIPGI